MKLLLYARVEQKYDDDHFTISNDNAASAEETAGHYELDLHGV